MAEQKRISRAEQRRAWRAQQRARARRRPLATWRDTSNPVTGRENRRP